MLEEDGSTVVGYKLGLTSRPMQELLGVDQPDYSALLSALVYDDGAELSLDSFIAPKIEAELAVVLERPLRGPGVTAALAAQAVAGVVAALEVVDSRIVDWKIKLVDTIADLASCGAVVLGPQLVPIQGWDPRYAGMVIRRNGQMEATGAGAAALGSPLGAVAWLANTLGQYGAGLEEGQVILTGSLHRAFDLERGDRVRADFDRLGAVGCRFT